MTTPRDLLIVVMEIAGSRPVGPGDLSLALAGAELIDLLKTPTIRLDGGRIVPGHLPLPADRLLTEALLGGPARPRACATCLDALISGNRPRLARALGALIPIPTTPNCQHLITTESEPINRGLIFFIAARAEGRFLF